MQALTHCSLRVPLALPRAMAAAAAAAMEALAAASLALSAALAPASALYESALSSAPFVTLVAAPVDALLAPLHDVANAYLASLDACLARYLLAGVLLSYPLAAATRLLPGGRAARDAWLAGCGALTCYFVFGRAWESLLLVALLCFAVLQARFLPQRHIAAVALASGYLVSRKWAQASTVSSEGMDDSVLHVVFGERVGVVDGGGGSGTRAHSLGSARAVCALVLKRVRHTQPRARGHARARSSRAPARTLVPTHPLALSRAARLAFRDPRLACPQS